MYMSLHVVSPLLIEIDHLQVHFSFVFKIPGENPHGIFEDP